LPDGSPADYTITLGLVVFADESMSGPKKSGELDEVLGMFLGIDTTNPQIRGTFKPKSVGRAVGLTLGLQVSDNGALINQELTDIGLYFTFSMLVSFQLLSKSGSSGP
jgi:hypothetical protein